MAKRKERIVTINGKKFREFESAGQIQRVPLKRTWKKTKKVGKFNFILKSVHENKESAEKKAKELRKQGHNARIVSRKKQAYPAPDAVHKGKHGIYLRTKGRKERKF